MPIVLFKNAFEGNVTNNVAIASDKVISVFQVLDPLDASKKRLFTAIYAGPDLTWTVKEPMDEVLNRLNKETYVAYTIEQKEANPVAQLVESSPKKTKTKK
jgi:hypothetical protein